MYVCLCNGFTDKDVRECANRGADRVSQVYRSLGHRPRCCKCVKTIRETLDEHREQREAQCPADAA
ncbi:MAG: (2Fe-2S)-binding protein [Myxococcales bacterium]|nr:(2Fe-2S)-binding protein [Myxococcales bacterium]